METLYQAGLRNIALFTLAGFMALLLASCGRGDTQSAPPPSSATVSLSFLAMGGQAPAGAVSALAVDVGPAGSVVTLEVFLISVEEIELELVGESEEESDIEFEGSFIVNVLDSTIQDNTPAPVDLVTSLPEGIYDELEFELIPTDQFELIPPDQLVPLDMTPWSLFVSGSYESLIDGARTFVIKINADDDIEVENPAGIVIAGNDNDLVLAFRLDNIFTPELLDRLLTLDGATGKFVLTSPSAQASEFLEVLEAALDFEETRVRIIAPVAPGDITVGQSLKIMGIMVNVTAATEDEDGIVSSGITADAQIEVRGFADDNGEVLATRIRDKGAPDFDDVRLRGPVSSIPGRPVFQILGVNVDTTGATLIGPDESSVNETEFFDQLVVGAEVDVEHGSFDGIDTVSNGPNDMVIELKD